MSCDEEIAHYCRLLHINPQGTYSDLKTAYRFMLKKYHPDLNRTENNKILLINEAYEKLEEYFLERKKNLYSEDMKNLLGELKVLLAKFAKDLKRPLARINTQIPARIEEIKKRLVSYRSEDTGYEIDKIILFLEHLLLLRSMPAFLKVESGDDRKTFFIYRDLYASLIRAVELAFGGIKSVKRGGRLWRYYLFNALENLEKLSSLLETGADYHLFFLSDFLGNFEMIVYYMRDLKSVMNFRDYYGISSV